MPFAGVAQHLVEPAFLGLAGEERDAERLRLAHVRRHLRQHRDAAGDVKAADADRQSGGEERPRQIDRARKLVGLHADQRDQRRAAGLADHPDDPLGADAPVGLVIGVQADVDVRARAPCARCASSARPFRQASVLEGMAERSHWIG